MMGGSDDVTQGPQSSFNKKLNRKPAYTRYTQQELPHLKPLLSPAWVIGVLFCMGIVFIPLGLLTFSASASVVEIVYRYDDECMPENTLAKKVAYIQSPDTKKTCNKSVLITKRMKKPIYLYYELNNFHQNHRRYVVSKSDLQLQSKKHERDIPKCGPEDYLNGSAIVPCGIVAWSLFNDSYTISVDQKELEVSKKGISWFHESKYRYGADVYPKNFQSGKIIGGGKLDHEPLSNQEDLMVWMRVAPTPSFRKLYGIIHVDLESDQTIELVIENNYNTYMFEGEKKLVFSTASWLGGKNDFLGRAFLFYGGLSVFLAISFMILYYVKPRRFGDPSALSWRRNGGQ